MNSTMVTQMPVNEMTSFRGFSEQLWSMLVCLYIIELQCGISKPSDIYAHLSDTAKEPKRLLTRGLTICCLVAECGAVLKPTIVVQPPGQF